MRLTEAHVREFRREGVLAAIGVLADEVLQPVIAESKSWIDRRAQQLWAQGKIADPCEREPFERRFASLYAQCRQIERGLDLIQARLHAAFTFMRNENPLDRRGVTFIHRHTPHLPRPISLIRFAGTSTYVTRRPAPRRDARSTPPSSPEAAPIPSKSSPITRAGLVAGKRRSPARSPVPIG